ncbi:unnamed protein product [Mytilus edulis]|uniref:PWWP domain-containing protein n=1 Tax=Mytilus edulis TaxID=6550 RepID=A0A8S3PWY4_MYTED|nr:unnamed protein product [Mytilus edulis]
MKKKGVKRDKSKSIKQNRTEGNTSVREISVQTEEISPNLLYIASRLSTDDMGLYQSILSKDPVLPEVLMDGDDIQEEKKTRSIQESEQEENNSTYRVDDMSPKEPFTQRLFHRIPLRKTAPRGRAHVIQRTTSRTTQSNSNANQETKHKSSETSGENILPSCSSFFNVDPQKGQSSFKNLESTVEVHDKISEQSWCRQKVRNGIDQISNTLTDNDVSSSLNSAAVIREYKKIISNRKTNILSSGSLGIGTKSTGFAKDLQNKKKCMEERNNNSSYHVHSDTVKQDSPNIALPSLETEVTSNTEESSPMIALSSLETEVISNTDETCEFDKERAENQDNVSCHEERTENLGNVSCNLNSKIVENDLHVRDILEETVEDAKEMTNETVTKEPEVQKFVPLLSASVKTVKSKSEGQSLKEQHNDNDKKELINVESKIKKNVKGKSVNQLSKKLHNDKNKKASINVESKIKKNAKQKKNMNTDNSETVHKNTNLIAGSPIETGKEGIEKSSNGSNNAMLEGVASYKRWQHENLLKKKSFVSPKEDCNNNNKTCGKNGDNSIAIQNPHKKPCYTFDQKEDSGQNRNKQDKIKKCGQHQGDVFSIGGSDDIKGSENNNASSDSHSHLNSMSPILELQEPDVSLDNNCFKSLLPPLLRPTVTVEAEVHISMREMEKFQQKENSSVQGLHSDLSQSQNKQIQELLGQLDISDIVGTSGINSTPEKMTKGKIKKQKRKKPRMVNEGKEITRTRHIRSCAPTVFYKKGKKKLETGEKLDTQFANNLSKNDQLNHHFMEQEFGKVEKHESMTKKDIIEHTMECITDVAHSSQKITTISAPPPVTGRIIRKNCIIMKRKRSKEEKISSLEPPLKLRKISSDENGACVNNYSDEQPEIATLDQTIENDKSEERNAFLEDKESENIDVESSQILSLKTHVAEVYNEDKTGKEKDINKDVYWNHGATSEVEEGIVELQVDESDNIESGIGSDSDCNNRDGGDLNGEPDCVNVLGTNNNLEGQISTYGLDTKIDNILKRKDEDQESVDFEESRNVMNTGFKNSPNDDSFISECSSLSNENQVELLSEKHHDVNLHTAGIEEMTDFIAGRIKEKAAKKHMKFEKIGRGAAGWEDSLRQKPKKTEIFQVNPAPQKLQSKDAQNSGSGNSELNERSKKAKRGRPRLHEKASGDHEIDPTLEIRTDHKLSDDSNFGQVVWGKLGRQRWWPAIVVEGYMVLRKQAEPGHSWLFWFGDHKITEHRTYVHTIESAKQDWYSVTSVIEHTLKTIKDQMPNIKSVVLRSDNAGCYHCSNLWHSLHGISQRTGVYIKEYDFSEAQNGKSYCDSKIAHMRGKMRKYVLEGGDITSSTEMKEALDVCGGVSGCQISNVTINTESQTKDQSQLKGITKYSNVKIDHDGRLTCWKAFGIGEGQRITMSSFNQEGTNLNVLEDFSLPKHIEGSIKTSNSIVNEQLPREGDLYCPEMTCSRKFKSYSELEDHCFVGDHALCPTHDLIKLQWKGVCLDISSCSIKTREGSLQNGDSTLQTGWGLKKDRKSVRFSLKIKNYLKEIFDCGEKSGQKANAGNVAKNMRISRDNTGKKIFSPNEYLQPSQIISYFSRLALLLKCPSKKDCEVSDEDLESAIALINRSEALEELL